MRHEHGQGVPKNHAEAASWHLKAAGQGHAGAQYKLGVMHYRGQGVTEDQTEAVRWHLKAAGQGHAGAQYKLGVDALPRAKASLRTRPRRPAGTSRRPARATPAPNTDSA